METKDDLTVVIRRAAAADVPGIHRVLSDTWHDSYDTIMGAGEVDRRVAGLFDPTRLIGLINTASGNDWYGVAQEGEQVIGFAQAAFGLTGRLSVWMIYVHPNHQSRGIGTRFLFAIAEAFPYARSVFVEVLEANTAAIRFYRRNGFETLGVINDPARATVPIMGMMQRVPNSVPLIDAVKYYLAAWF